MAASITARGYHERTKHLAARYAPGPETIDWTEPPNPFRTFAGAPQVELPLSADSWTRACSDRRRVAPAELSRESLGAFFQLTFAIAAWKRQGPDQWALRCLPSSGNLHPTEAYLVARGVAQLGDGLYHYEPREHALVWRRRDDEVEAPPCCLIGMSSLHWREAWKYGERAFRYCQLDLGHALAGLHYAAAVLGWRVRPLWSLSSEQVASCLGLDREQDFADVEREEPALIAWIDTGHCVDPLSAVQPSAKVSWSGTASRIDPHPMYRWPVIDEVALQTRRPEQPLTGIASPPGGFAAVTPSTRDGAQLSHVIRARRSAQRFDARYVLSASRALRLFEALFAETSAYCASLFTVPCVHVVALVQRVDGLGSGMYALPRSRDGEATMRRLLDARFSWQHARQFDRDQRLLLLSDGSVSGAGRQLCCGQAIASDCNLLFVFLSEFGDCVEQTPDSYRLLHWEAGLLGQMLYIEAQALGLAGTGIGCFLDDEWHRFLGISEPLMQVLYCFSVGMPHVDERIQTMPPYPERSETRRAEPRGVTP